MSFFIPTDFIQNVDAQEKRITLSVDFNTVQHATWNRLPDFIARGNDTEVALTAN